MLCQCGSQKWCSTLMMDNSYTLELQFFEDTFGFGQVVNLLQWLLQSVSRVLPSDLFPWTCVYYDLRKLSEREVQRARVRKPKPGSIIVARAEIELRPGRGPRRVSTYAPKYYNISRPWGCTRAYGRQQSGVSKSLGWYDLCIV